MLLRHEHALRRSPSCPSGTTSSASHGLRFTRQQMLQGVFRAHPNASRFDNFLPLGLSLYQFSVFPPGLALRANTSEIYHSGLKLDDPVTKEQTHEYLLLSSPRKVKGRSQRPPSASRCHAGTSARTRFACSLARSSHPPCE